MKKILFAGMLLILVSLSACSLKKNDANNQNNIGSKTVVGSKNISNIVENNGQDVLSGLTSKEDSLVTKGAKVLNCSDGPIKISDLKSGDIFNSHVIKTISSEANDLKGLIVFSGEEILTGVLVINKESGEGIMNISFIPDDKNWMPTILYKNTKVNGAEGVNGLICGAPSFNLNVPEINEGNDTNKFDFPLLSSKISDFKAFWSKTELSANYPKKVKIKIDTINLPWVTAGSPAVYVNLKEVIKVIN